MHSHGATLASVSTIADVAKRAKVSRTTVSHVINHADRVSKPLRERVQQVIDELGYSPNPQAQSLRTGRTNVVAMLIADILNAFFPEMVKTAQSELERVGLDMLIFNTDVPGGRSQEHAREYLRQIKRRRVDGLIVGDVALHGMHDALINIDVPTVFIGYLSNNAVDSVRTDGFQGGYLVGEYLAKKGHRRVANITGPSFFEEAVARSEGFERGLSDHGAPITPKFRFEGTYLPPSGREAVKWLLDTHRNQMPTAVLFANHLMATGGLAEFHDRGIRVPDDIAVTVFDDLPELEYVRPRLTRVGVSPRVLAERASAMLISRLNGERDGPPRTEVVPCVLREFDTA
jgi:DNA-binding LacI/PurR family transcriptional regulator